MIKQQHIFSYFHRIGSIFVFLVISPYASEFVYPIGA